MRISTLATRVDPEWATRPKRLLTTVPDPAEVRFELPPSGRHRLRQLVNRGAPRPVSKLYSLKLSRVVQCESSLEVDVGTLLDASSSVIAFGEQPLALHFFDGERFRRHVPDFRVQLAEGRYLIEVKFESDLDQKIEERTRLLSRLLVPYGWHYRVVTERTVRRGAFLANARKLLLRGRRRPPDVWSLVALDRIRKTGLCLGDFGWGEVGRPETGWIAHEILCGNAHVDWIQHLDASSLVRATAFEQGGVLPWLLAHSK